MNGRNCLLLVAGLLVQSCTEAGGADLLKPSMARVPSRALTVWTERHEYFIEHDLPVAGEEASMAIHVTDLADGSARTEGPLRLRWTAADRVVELELPAPARAGIFLGAVVLPVAGEWSWTLALEGDSPLLPSVIVHPSRDAALEAAELEMDGGITMLKEQQWPLRLRTARAGPGSLAPSVLGSAVVEAAPERVASLPATASGTLLASADGAWPKLGQTIVAGQTLAKIAIPWLLEEPGHRSAGLALSQARTAAEVAATAALAERERASAEVVRARAERDRVSALHAQQAKSPRELETAEYGLAAALASERAAANALDAWTSARSELDLLVPPASLGERIEVPLLAPVSGIVTSGVAGPNRPVQVGEPLFRVADLSRVRLRVRVPEADMSALTAEIRLRARIPGQEWSLIALPLDRLAIPLAVDPPSRMAEIFFEVANPGWLREGAVLEARLESAGVPCALVVPRAALLDEDGLSVIYIQQAGERFERRVVRVGARDAEYAEILEGLQPGERIVIDGSYVVRLVSLSGAIPEHSH